MDLSQDILRNQLL